MFAFTLPRPVSSLVQAFGITKSIPASPRGRMPSWVEDPQLSRDFLKDTGLSLEDLGGQRSYDPSLPFFLQRNFW